MRLLALLLFAFLQVAQATTYYVRTDGLDGGGHTGTSNTAGSAWLTIQKAATTMVAGDITRVQTGSYPERTIPAASGTAGNTITYVADGVVTFGGMDVSSKNYNRVIGFVIDTDAGLTISNRAIALSGTCTGWEFWSNTIRDANFTGIGNGSYSDRSSNFIIIGNTFINIGNGSNNGSAVSLIGNDNLIAANILTAPSPDAMIGFGQRNRWLTNYIYGTVDPADLHADIIQIGSHTLGFSQNVFEGNLIIGNGALPNEHGILLQNQGGAGPCEGGACGAITENLFRRNVWHNLSGGVDGVSEATIGTITEIRHINETIADVMTGATSTGYSLIWYGTGVTSGRVHNTIFYKGWGSAVTTGVECFRAESDGVILSADYNLAYTPSGSVTFAASWTNQAHEQSNVDPLFTNVAGDNFTLQSGSGARNVGGPLTTASGSGTGTTFSVASQGGGYFRGANATIAQYSGALAPGDVITVGTDVVTVSSISTDSITVTSSFTWVNGESVYLGSSTTPDIGAVPFGAASPSGTISNVGTAYTVATSGDVRFVAFYEDGIPVAVDAVAPYQYTSSGGSVTAYISALYATATPMVGASVAASGATINTINAVNFRRN